jgi:putative FmdB family regulatory protein
MPTYQYACTSCGEELEAVQKFSDDPLTECPACAGRLRKVFSPVGVVFKGSGFYKTDSRSSGKKSATKDTPDKDTREKKDSSDNDRPEKKDSSDKKESTGKSDDKPSSGAKSDKPASSSSSSGQVA